MSVGAAGALTMPHKKKALSLSTIVWAGPSNQDFSAEFVAEAKGFFAQQGITSSTNELDLLSAATWVATVLGGSAQFMNGGSNVIASVEAGAPMRAIGVTDTPSAYSISINTAYAQAHNIPLESNTGAEALAQFKALKGTHIRVSIGNTISNSWDFVVALCDKYGLTYGVSNPNADIDLQVVGSSTLAIDDLQEGNVDAVAAQVPYSPSPPQTLINIWRIPPIDEAPGDYTLTTISMMQQHPDTVQAVVTALVEAEEYVKTHPNQAYHAIEPYYSIIDLASTPTLKLMLFKVWAVDAWLMYPTTTGYNAEALIVNEGQAKFGKQIALPAQDFQVTRFAAVALKQLGLKI